MILGPVFAAIRQVTSPPLRRMVVRSLGLTVVLLVALWVSLTKAFDWFLRVHPISRDYPLIDGLVYVLGAEGEGMDAELAKACDLRLSIPGTGAVESLNVAAATAVLLAAWARR